MAIQMISANEVKLLSVKDLRPIDWNSGQRVAIPVEECNVCDRCGKYHVKVYEVWADGVIYNVGSGCCKRLFGWEPAKQDVQAKERIAEEKALQEALQKATQEFMDQVNALVAPRPKFDHIETALDGIRRAIWKADGIIAVSAPNQMGLNIEKRTEFTQRWRKAQAEKMLQEYANEYKANRAQTKRAQQLAREVKKQVA